MRGSEHAELRAFVAVAEQGNFARAAAHLGVSASALSQTIRHLEERLGARLLNRTTRSVSLTEIGSGLLDRLRPALADIDAAVATAMGAAHAVPAGRVRINSTRDAAVHYLAPLLAGFMQAHPLISLDVVVDDRLVDIVAGGFDIGIRLGECLEQDMHALSLSGELRMMVVAAPGYLQRHGTPRTPQDLRGHQCLSYRWPTDNSVYRWEFEKRGRSLQVAVEGALVVSDPQLLTPIVLAGAGIAYVFAHQVQALVEQGRLVHLLADWTPAFPGFYLYYFSQRQMAPAVRAFIDFVGQALPSIQAGKALLAD